MPKPSEVIKIKPRRCKYCKLNFTPVAKNEQQRKNAEAQKFCKPAHRTAYHRYGGINFDQLVEKAAAKVKEALLHDEAFIAIAAKAIHKFRMDSQLTSEEIRRIIGRVERENIEQYNQIKQGLSGDSDPTLSLDALEYEVARVQRIKSKLTGKGPIGREAAQALSDSFSTKASRSV